MNEARDPESLEEWQRAVDVASALWTIHDARLSGLITGGPTVDVDRCQQLLDEGRRRGIVPRPDCLERMVRELT